jgi:hypothetical protein
MSLKRDVESIAGLRGHYHKGLQALRAADRARLTVVHPIGSADIDTALASVHPTDARWDYLVGKASQTSDIVLLWVEVHPASGEHTIKEIDRKLTWLLAWMAPTPLNRYKRRFYWVSSGRCAFTARDSRIKSLAQRGVIFCGGRLDS